jgi:hypothetical protein
MAARSFMAPPDAGAERAAGQQPYKHESARDRQKMIRLGQEVDELKMFCTAGLRMGQGGGGQDQREAGNGYNRFHVCFLSSVSVTMMVVMMGMRLRRFRASSLGRL